MASGTRKYTFSARFYDLISFEWPVYRAGRTAAVGMLGLRPGDRVLDLCCGTGLNFPLLELRLGPTGLVVGVDRSAQMVAQARRRVKGHGWGNVRLVENDVADLTADDLADLAPGGFDAVVATYALSLVPGWWGVLDTALAACAPGARVAVVDMQDPVGRFAVLTPLARLACRLGGADIHAHPWTHLEQRAARLERASVRGGHIQVAVATLP